MNNRNKNRYIVQFNRIESLEINLNIYGKLIFNKDAKTIQRGNNSLKSGTGTNGH